MTARRDFDDYPPPVLDRASGCLRWQGPHNEKGYGRLGRRYAHRVAWERENGPIPDGLTIDHVAERGCRWRDCIAVEHLEPVTQGENTSRSARSAEQRSRTHCPQQHEYTPENTIRKPTGKRECRQCGRDRNARRYAAQGAALAAAGTPRRAYVRRTPAEVTA